jgi:hypothetical protein
MAQIHGQIESLKRLKNELRSYGIHRFNSIKEINDFLNNFQLEKETIINKHREILGNEIRSLNLAIKENREKCEGIKRKTITEIEVKIDSIRINIDSLKERINKSFLHKIFFGYSLKQQKKLLEYYNSNSQLIILNAIKSIQKIIENDEDKLREFTTKNELIINKRSFRDVQKLNYVKKTIENLHSLIAGAIGENLVVKEIEKLPDDYILINDYNLKFNPPIYNRNTNDKIFSIQIDHLLISKSGIYILETKNWSKRSIESLDLRSPVEQITRTSYALFLLVNKAKIGLTEHHWGDKQIPIKNIIVMINEKPKEDFKYVKVKSVKELSKYLTYFEPIFTETEVNRIAKYLISIQN